MNKQHLDSLNIEDVRALLTRDDTYVRGAAGIPFFL